MRTYFNRKTVSRLISMLVLTVILISSNGPSLASTLSNNTFTYLDPNLNEGVYLREFINIDGKEYVIDHIKENNNESRMEIYGDSRLTLVKKGDNNVYGYEDGTLVSTAIIQEDTYYDTISPYSDSDWRYFGPDKIVFTWGKAAMTIIIASTIAHAVGGPVGLFTTIAAGVSGISVGGYAYKSGRYRIVGRGVEGEYSSEIYTPEDGYLGTVNWSGKR